MKKILFTLPLLLLSATAEARIANDMNCVQAQAHYNANGRILVRTYSGDVVPIYGLRHSCNNGQESSSFFTRTRDSNRCHLGYRCHSRGR